MPRSLFARLLTLSLAVAVAAVAATAWLTTRTTSTRIAGEFDRQLEADAFVYTRLLEHASSSPDWSGVGPLLHELARRTGQRLALTTDDGERLLDTAASPEATPLPEVPAALIDPFDPLQEVASDPESDDASPPLVPDIVLDTPAVRAERAARLREASACLREAGIDLSAEEYVELAADGGGEVPPRVPAGCNPWGAVGAPTDTEVALAADVRDHAMACLEDVPVTERQRMQVQALLRAHATGQLVSRTGSPVPDDVPAPASESSGTGVTWSSPFLADPAVAGCIAGAYRAVYEPYVAEPALLWIGEGPAEDVLGSVGGGRLLGALAVVLAVAIGVTVVAGRRLVAPVRALTEAADRMGAGERTARVDVRGRDEVARLGAAFNRMAASVDAGEQQRRAMVSDIAHELRTPLTTLRGHLEGAQDGVLEVDGEFVDSMHDEALLLQRLVDDLQQLALADAGQLHVVPQPADAGDLARHVVAAHRTRADGAGIELDAVANGPVPVEVDPDRIRQALANLVRNALTYTPRGGRVEVRARLDGGRAVLEVIDSGIGIAPDDLPHVFDRFYRADPSRSRATGGSGLGLAITRSLIEANGGSVTAASEPGRGSTFTIVLPATLPGQT